MGLVQRIERKLWKTALGEASWVDHRCDFRTRELHGRVQRANYAYGMLRAADVARYFGKNSVTVVEFGVASGDGLFNMCSLAPLIEKETGIKFKVVGFDSGCGLPSVAGYKDHPELWNPGDFPTGNPEAFAKKLGDRAEIKWGDISETVAPFISELSADCPLGFVSVDVDIYSAAKSSLLALTGAPEKYNPAVTMYFDDVSFFFANAWCGELAAISEFNAQRECRKIDLDRSLPGLRPLKADGWYRSMYVCHVLDHPFRQVSRDRSSLDLADHLALTNSARLR